MSRPAAPAVASRHGTPARSRARRRRPVFIQGGSGVSVQIHGGLLTTVGITAGSTGAVMVRNPWPGKQVQVVDGGNLSTVVVAASSAGTLSIPATAGHTYVVQQADNPVSGMSFATVTASPAAQARHLGPVSIGLP